MTIIMVTLPRLVKVAVDDGELHGAVAAILLQFVIHAPAEVRRTPSN
jgi:hypothetical protein